MDVGENVAGGGLFRMLDVVKSIGRKDAVGMPGRTLRGYGGNTVGTHRGTPQG